MARTGRKPKPAKLRVLEGNPGKRPIEEGVLVQPICPDRPNWAKLLPNRTGKRRDDQATALRRDAAHVWDTVVLELDTLGLLGRVDEFVIVDMCVCRARLLECERILARDGTYVTHERGTVRHPVTTVSNMYRQQLRFYVGELGLSPSARMRLKTPGGADGRDPEEDEVFGS